MGIVPQSPSISYCPFPMLPAPRIAGLLPAKTGTQHPPIDTFTYTNPHLNDLADEQRLRLFNATSTLLDVALAHTRGEVNDHALNTALSLFRRAVTGQPMRPMNPAQFNAEMDVTLLEWAANRARRTGGRHGHHE